MNNPSQNPQPQKNEDQKIINPFLTNNQPINLQNPFIYNPKNSKPISFGFPQNAQNQIQNQNQNKTEIPRIPQLPQPIQTSFPSNPQNTTLNISHSNQNQLNLTSNQIPQNNQTNSNITPPLNQTVQPPQTFPSNKPPIISGQFEYYELNKEYFLIKKKEVITVMQNLLSCMSINSNNNYFKYIVYNPIPQNFKEEGIQNNLKLYFPLQIVEGEQPNSYNLIDFNLWENGNKYNPFPSELYPYQLSSTLQLKKRTQKDEIIQKSIQTKFQTIKENLEEMNQNCEQKVKEQLMLIQNKRVLIKEKMFNINKMISKIALLKGQVEIDERNKEVLYNQMESIKMRIGYINNFFKQFDFSVALPAEIFNEHSEVENNLINKKSDERKKKNNEHIKKIKYYVDSLSERLKHKIKVIQNIKENLKKEKK